MADYPIFQAQDRLTLPGELVSRLFKARRLDKKKTIQDYVSYIV